MAAIIASFPVAWIRWLLVALATIAPGTALARDSTTGVAVRTCIAPMRPSLSPRSLLNAPEGFDCTGKQSRYGSGDFDIIAPGLSYTTGQDGRLAVRWGSAWQRDVVLYALYADGTIAQASMDQVGMSRHLQLGAVIQTLLPARNVAIKGLLWRVHAAGNMRGVVFGARLATVAESNYSNLLVGALYAGFAGLCLALLVHNLALWFALRHPFQLAYCAMVASLATYAVSSSGALAWLMPTIHNNDRLRINYVMLALSTVTAVNFARYYFERRVFEGWLTKFSHLVCANLLIATMAFIGFGHIAPVGLNHYYSLSFLFVLLIAVPMVVRAWTRDSDYLWLFAIAWAAPIGFAGIRVANQFNLFGYSLLIDSSTVIAMALEAILSSLAIAYRIHLLSRERDEAREQETAALRLAATDPLTGLLNRRALLDEVLGRDEDQMLLIADLDHFKRVNETIGHDGGDEVLRLVARGLTAAVPPDALVARIGGEEFAIIGPAKSALSAADVLDQLRSQRMPFDISVTASIGGCTGPLKSDVDWKRLYRLADRALFEAKAAGRDRSRIAHVDLAA